MIVSDIDNMLANTNSLLEKKYRSYSYPYPVPPGYFTTADGLKLLADAPPMPNAADVVSQLARDLGGITYVTTRPRIAEVLTYRWLKTHGFPKGRVIFCAREEKAGVVKNLAPALVAEDDPWIIPLLLRLGVPVLVHQWPYNKHLTGDRLIKFKRWLHCLNLGSATACN
ncbi:MAG: hypothetical protein HPY90_11805 [Syntrophothermus sp.]|uniref:LNS2 domain-containing protein n=1 Tax=Syntrophothermus sp. TaxID=2736299 RepID=UPI0025806635|nr:hypothetical protein [Syntrophothermus sp.]NSW83932.1 hypothetical protein [Syntrophothermus sp.]